MKIEYAAIEEQEKFIEELGEKIYRDIFPKYFLEKDIQSFKNQGVLSFMEHAYQGTLKESFTIMTSLQTIHTVLTKTNLQDSVRDEVLFDKNCTILNHYGLHFPFVFSDFKQNRIEK